MAHNWLIQETITKNRSMTKGIYRKLFPDSTSLEKLISPKSVHYSEAFWKTIVENVTGNSPVKKCLSHSPKVCLYSLNYRPKQIAKAI